ncbi:MAG: DUF3372 domain-containing protein, partial [Coleofasciculaceae cyanobacterium SM2_3_26]|nr:DUF3372 domain-containing protein [Coleofasciculaceae cyanobacterium SM2_3_26]
QTRVKFHNTGSQQQDGLIVMSITDRVEPDLDSDREDIVILFNAHKIHQSIALPDLAGIPMELHPVLATSNDPVVKQASYDMEQGQFTVPPRTTAVFVAPEPKQPKTE